MSTNMSTMTTAAQDAVGVVKTSVLGSVASAKLSTMMIAAQIVISAGPIEMLAASLWSL